MIAHRDEPDDCTADKESGCCEKVTPVPRRLRPQSSSMDDPRPCLNVTLAFGQRRQVSRYALTAICKSSRPATWHSIELPALSQRSIRYGRCPILAPYAAYGGRHAAGSADTAATLRRRDFRSCGSGRAAPKEEVRV